MEKLEIERTISEMAKQARKSSRRLAALPTAAKDRILLKMADAIIAQRKFITSENQKDLVAGREKGLSKAMLDRLELSPKVIESMVKGLREVVALPDPVGQIDNMKQRPSGITVGRMRVPLGVVGIIYESRPNVTVDAAALCLKSGNATFLRGGSEAICSNLALIKVLQATLVEEGVDPAAIQIIQSTDREAVNSMLAQEEYIDIIIPRGGEGLIRFVTQNSHIPVLKHYKGVCHAYIDKDADIDMGVKIVLNGKTQRPGVCNALEGLLVHKDQAEKFIPIIVKELVSAGVRIRGCERCCKLSREIVPALESDWGTEFLDLIIVIKVVDDMDEAIAYIEKYGSNHTETIVTNYYNNAQRFLREVDASAVMVNASTRFNDGGQFGLGAEIGISTTKLHAYGPMGLEELTTRKFIVYGNGEIRA